MELDATDLAYLREFFTDHWSSRCLAEEASDSVKSGASVATVKLDHLDNPAVKIALKLGIITAGWLDELYSSFS